MKFRQATEKDIDEIMKIRLLVKENVISDPSKITKQMCIDYLEKSGCGWVCEINHQIVGFSYAAIKDNSIWALFILPSFEAKGIGTELLKKATSWLFIQGAEEVILETEANTRADGFYHSQGWQRGKVNDKGDVTYVLAKDMTSV